MATERPPDSASPLGACDTCGAPATMLARDLRERAPVDGWQCYAYRGADRRGCARHPVQSSLYDRRGRYRGLLTTEQGRGIPLLDPRER